MGRRPPELAEVAGWRRRRGEAAPTRARRSGAALEWRDKPGAGGGDWARGGPLRASTGRAAGRRGDVGLGASANQEAPRGGDEGGGHVRPVERKRPAARGEG